MILRNLALVLVLAAVSPAAFAGGNGRKKLDQMSTTKDRWDELMSDEQIEDDKPKREVIRLPAAPARPAQTKTVAKPNPSQRMPASTPPVRVAPAAHVFPVAAITFDEYLAENGRNPSLSKLIPDHQVAFTDTSAPAVITMPGSESASAQSTAGQAAGGGANPSAVQAAAAAAAAAGLIPAGTSLPAAGASGGGSQYSQPQTTGSPVR